MRSSSCSASACLTSRCPTWSQRVGEQLILQKVLLAKAASLGIAANDDDVRNFLHTGQYGELLFPNGQFIGEDKYRQFISSSSTCPPADFEKALADDITINRLRSFITDGVTVSDKEIRDQYRKQNIKIKFDYAVISSDDLRKQINPTDADLQAFFTKNAARYAKRRSRRAQDHLLRLHRSTRFPAARPRPRPQEIQAYYNAHQAEYQVPEQARSRHILIKFPGGAAKTDAEAKAKAEASPQADSGRSRLRRSRQEELRRSRQRRAGRGTGLCPSRHHGP